MRCIEIPMQTTGKMAQQRLTLTWDVLKWFQLKFFPSAPLD